MSNQKYDMMRLRAAGDPKRLDEILQEECREKTRDKLPQTLLCDGFKFPTLLSAEQCTSDSLAEQHSLHVNPGDEVLDMTCGLAIDAFHIARRAARVTAIDIDPKVADAARDNARALGLANVDVICADSVVWLGESGRRFDVIFIDPARRSSDGRRLRALADCSPDVTSCLSLLKERSDKLIVKASPMLDVAMTVKELGGDADIMVYGAKGECKELTAIVPGNGLITVTTPGRTDFSFTLAEEAAAKAPLALPVEGDRLFEPSAAAMKTGAFNLLATRFELKKLDKNTHLYLGDSHVGDFPGTSRRIVRVERYSKHISSEMKSLLADGADVTVRNFLLTAEALASKLGITRGGKGRRRLYGVRCGSAKLLLMTVAD